MPSRKLLACLALLLPAALTGCAGESSSPVVLHVGTVAIEKATVEHWARAIELGSAIEGALGRSSSTPRQKALEFLISSNWAIGAAAERGLGVSAAAVKRGVGERIAAAPHGRGEFEEEISATGQTLGDVSFEVKAALAAAALRESLSSSVQAVTEAQIADYYRRHLQSFRIPERRVVDLIEEIPSYARAQALGRRLGPGARFAKRAIRELVPRQTPYEDAHRDNGLMVEAIFATPPQRVGGPVMFHGRWVLLVVRKLVHGSIKPLVEVKAEISGRLSGERHRQALRSFLAAYRREWTAKTRCKAGFVVQGCSDYRGPLVSEGNPLDV